jgi:sodium-coupled neutral amino acid transporter 11
MSAASLPRSASLSFHSAFSSAQFMASVDVESLNDDPSSLPRQLPAVNTTTAANVVDAHQELTVASATAPPSSDRGGSSVCAAVLNFTNAIIGAGAIGLGGAFALSGGCIAIVSILACANLTKSSLDLVLELSLEQGVTSYEELGHRAFGQVGQLSVTASKFLYSFGCLVAYLIVIKENLGPALAKICPTVMDQVLNNSNLLTFSTSLLVILPLCLLRDMTKLAKFSLLSVMAMVMIVGIVAFLYFFPPSTDHEQDKSTTTYEDWFEIRWSGYLQSLGTFVFTFVSVRSFSAASSDTFRASVHRHHLAHHSLPFLQQHMVHMAYASLKPEVQTLRHWKKVSSWSLSLACAVSLAIGCFAYMTFWQAQGSDIFEMYPSLAVISIAKLLLCGTMLLTFPLPFFSCREMFISLWTHSRKEPDQTRSVEVESCELEQPLLPLAPEDRSDAEISPYLIGEGQLLLVYHVVLTVALWLITTGLAIVAPNLGDILDVVGCATGSAIAFVIPALLSLKLKGYNLQALVLLTVGVTVLIVGTFYGGKKLVQDIYRLA